MFKHNVFRLYVYVNNNMQYVKFTERNFERECYTNMQIKWRLDIFSFQKLFTFCINVSKIAYINYPEYLQTNGKLKIKFSNS